MSFNASKDTEAAIQRRCAWRVLYDAGLAHDWTSDFHLNLAKAAEMLRAKISAAKGCTPDEVAVVFLIDEMSRLPEHGLRWDLRHAIGVWQHQELAEGRLSFSVVAASLSVATDWGRDLWCDCELPVTELCTMPLVKIPQELTAEIVHSRADSLADLDHDRWSDLKGNIVLAAGHPGTLEDIAQALADIQEKTKKR
jgi:hypothetical protein